MNIIITTKRNISGGTKIKRSREFMFTWNNYHEWTKQAYTKQGIDPKKQAIHFIEERSKQHNFQYVFQIEGYGKNQTPHLQGYIEADHLMSYEEFSMPSTVHMEKRKGNKGQAIGYVTDVTKRKWHTKPYYSEKMEKSIQEDTKIILPDAFYPWQNDAFPIIECKPCRRTIHWFWDLIGNTGKTEFIRHLTSFHGALLIQGSAEDIKHAVAKRVKDTGVNPMIILLELTRSMDKPVSYQGLELVKSGIFTSTKYNHFEVNMNPPHLFVFSNFEPRIGALSSDRWAVHEICSVNKQFTHHYLGDAMELPDDYSRTWLQTSLADSDSA